MQTEHISLSDSVNRKFVEQFDVSDWEVETDSGWHDVISSNKTIKYEIFEVETEAGQILRCADDHILFDENYEEVFAKDALYRFVQTRTGPQLVTRVVGTGVEEHMYDLSVDSDDHRYWTDEFLSHNTTTSAAYILWYVLFQKSKTAAILANKAPAAREVMSRLQLMFENLPDWLQSGIKTWNKGDIELENGGKVFTAATTASGIRGKSCVTGDTKVCMVDSNGRVFHASIDRFLETAYTKCTSNIYQVTLRITNKVTKHGWLDQHRGELVEEYTSGSLFKDGFLGDGPSFAAEVEQYGPDAFEYEILSKVESTQFPGDYSDHVKFFVDKIPSMNILSQGKFRRVKELLDQGKRPTLKVNFTDGTSIRATKDHLFQVAGIYWLETEKLIPGLKLSDKVVQSLEEGRIERVYDFFDVEDTHSYYTNGVESHNCNLLYIDECALIPNTIADQFFASVYPTISSGKETKILLSSTPIGYNHFWKFWSEAEQGVNGFVPVKVNYWDIPGRDEAWADEQRKNLGELKFQQEVLVSFLGSSETLVSSDSLRWMTPTRPIHQKDGLDTFEMPTKDHVYVLVADVAKGVGGDYSSFSVIDVTASPYRQVAKFRDNNIAPLLYPSVIFRVANLYNKAWVLIETNVSEQVAHILFYEMEYENLLFVARTAKGQQVSSGFSRGVTTLGVNTDRKVKRIGCTNLKSLIDEKKLIVQDADTIAEFGTFIARRDSYAADDGYHDDLVMTLVLFAWFTANSSFRDFSDIDLRQAMYSRRMKEIEEDLVPIGFYNDGTDPEEPPLNF